MEGVGLADLAKPLLKKLASETGETAHLAMLSDDQALLVEVCRSPLPIRAGAFAGTRVDLCCSAAGKIFLAWNYADSLAAFFKARVRQENVRVFFMRSPRKPGFHM